MRKLRHTWRLHQVFLLAVAVAADVVEGEEEVMLLMQLSRQLQLDLRRRGGETLRGQPLVFSKYPVLQIANE